MQDEVIEDSHGNKIIVEAKYVGTKSFGDVFLPIITELVQKDLEKNLHICNNNSDNIKCS